MFSDMTTTHIFCIENTKRKINANQLRIHFKTDPNKCLSISKKYQKKLK